METKKHRLLLYDLISRRMRGKVLLLVIFFLVAGIADWYLEFFGALWYFVWIGLAVSSVLWVYYGLLVKRASVMVREDLLLVQGPLTRFKVSYGRIISTTSVRLDRHHPYKSLSSWEKGTFRPLYEQTCLLVDLEGWPKARATQKSWLAKQLFSTSGPGILCSVEDWMSLSQDIEAARGEWLLRREKYKKGDTRSLAAKVMSLDDQ